jgi:DNA-binding GntR family transcriptional regulator
MEAISDLPMLHDIDADYSPQYVKLARIIRSKIESGQYGLAHGLGTVDLTREHNVSARVVWHALQMLEANHYVHRPRNFAPYVVTWRAGA